MSNSTETLFPYNETFVPNVWIVYQLDHDQRERAKQIIDSITLDHFFIRDCELDFGGPRKVFLSQPYQAVLCTILGVETLPAPKSYRAYDDARLWWNEDTMAYCQNRADWATYAKESLVYGIPTRFVSQHAIFMALEQPGDRNEILETLRAEYGEDMVNAVLAYRDRFCNGG